MSSFTKSPAPTVPTVAEMAAPPLLEIERPILLLARNSGTGGAKARNQAGNECHRTAEDFYNHTGIDVRHLIPTVADIVYKLKHESVRVVSLDDEGKPFTNEYLLLELAHNVYLLVSTGSGAKIDKDLNQPFLDFINDKLKMLKPGWLAWHRIDRIFRTALLAANTIHICNELDTTMCDGEQGPLEGDFASIMTLLRAREAAEEAKRIPKKTRAGQIVLTDTAMVEGSGRYGVSRVALPGLMAVRMKAPNGMKGETRLFFDTPDCFPRTADVAYGLPEQYLEVVHLHNAGLHEFDEDIEDAIKDSGQELDDDSHATAKAELKAQLRNSLETELWDDIDNGRISVNRVDQVANIRFALSTLGRPQWTINAVGRELIKRGFSTARLRMENTSRTAFTLEHVGGEVERVMRPILAQLEFYRSGTLPLRFGTKGVEDIEITGCFPPDGPWATPEDFDRIATYLQSTKGGGPATQGLTGVTVHTEHGELPLRSAPPKRATAGPSYVLRPSEAGVKGGLAIPPIPHHALAESLVEALITYAEQLLAPLVRSELPETESLRQGLRDAEQAVRHIEAACNKLLDRLSAEDGDGNPLITGPAVQGITDRYNDRVRDELTPAQATVRRLRAELDASAQTGVGQDPAIYTGLLLRMVEALRDPHDTSYNDLWKGAVRIETITRTPIRRHDTDGILVQWDGTIRISGAGQEFSAPFHGEYLSGNLASLPDRVSHALDRLLEGVPFDDIEQTNARGVRLALAERLGFETRYFGLPICEDPRLVKIAAHLAKDSARDVTKVSNLLGEPVDLVRNVLRQLSSGRPDWNSLADEPSRAA